MVLLSHYRGGGQDVSYLFNLFRPLNKRRGRWHGVCAAFSMYTFDEPQIKCHIRYIDPSCVHHVMSKTWGGLYLMTPKGEVREIITGILAQAKMKYPEIKLHYDVFGFDAAAYAVAKNKASNLKNPPLIPRKDFYQKRQIHWDVLKL